MNIYLEQGAEFFRRFSRFGGTIAMIKKLLGDDKLMERWIVFLAQQPEFRLIHGRFTPLADKIAMVKQWPGINPADVDVALATAMQDGTIAGYEAEVGKNQFLDAVVTVYRESIPATLVYARGRMRDVWGDKYCEWKEAYAQGVDENRVRAIDGAKPFVPNRIVIEVVDLRANWNPKKGTSLEDVLQTQAASSLAGFAVIYNAAQSPEWVRQMDGKRVPHAMVGDLLLDVQGWDTWGRSPNIENNDNRAGLAGHSIAFRLRDCAIPVLREYKR